MCQSKNVSSAVLIGGCLIVSHFAHVSFVARCRITIDYWSITDFWLSIWMLWTITTKQQLKRIFVFGSNFEIEDINTNAYFSKIF